MPSPSTNIRTSGKPMKLPTVQELLPVHRYRISSYVGTSSVTSIPNEGSKGGSLVTIQGTVALPVAEPTLNNALIINFTGTQQIQSNLANAEWNFLHKRLPFTVFYVTASNVCGFGNTNAAATVGFRFQINAGAISYVVSPNWTTSISYSTTVNVGMISRFSYPGSGNCEIRKNGVVGTSGFVGSPSALDATYKASLGYMDDGNLFNTGGKFAEFIAFDRVLTAQELAIVDAELFTKYGLHA